MLWMRYPDDFSKSTVSYVDRTSMPLHRHALSHLAAQGWESQICGFGVFAKFSRSLFGHRVKSPSSESNHF